MSSLVRKILKKTKKLFKTKSNQIFFYSPWDDKIDGQLNENSQLIYDSIGDEYIKVKYTLNGRLKYRDYYGVLKNFLESKVIVIDQTCSFLSYIELKDDQKVINIWHACGAFKKIEHDIPYYSNVKLKHLERQTRQYTNFIVSSPFAAQVHAHAMLMDEKDVLALGIPRTDIFYDESVKKVQIDDFYKKYPNLIDKEMILFAPTFRDTYKFDPSIDWDDLSKSLDSNEVFIIKRHIASKEDLLNGRKYENILYIEDVSLFTLMFVSKLLITDYSSVIFEYSLLNKPIIHYCPDFDKYVSIRGFYLDFNNDLFGDVIKDGDLLIDILSRKDYKLDADKLEKFKEKFMSACDGHATERVTKLIYKYFDE